MSSGTQVDMDWAGTEAADVGAGGSGTSDANGARSGAGAADARFLSDEEILGIDPPSPKGGYGGLGQSARGDSSGDVRPRNDREPDVAGEVGGLGEGSEVGQKGRQAEPYPTVSGSAVMPAWMVAASGDPKVAGEAAALWAEHQEMRAAVVELRGVAEEARAIKELLPGGVRDIVSLREATASVERIDAALFSGDARAQADVVGEMARVNPAAFRAMFAEAARVMAGMGSGGREAGRQEAGGAGQEGNFKSQISNLKLEDQNQNQFQNQFHNQGQNQNQNQNQFQNQIENQIQNQIQNRNSWQDAGATNANVDGRGNLDANRDSRSTNHPSQELRASESRFTNHDSQITNHQSPVTSHQSQTFDPGAYAAFERSTNETVARDVRGSISDTLARVMPEGVAEGAARRIGEDIFGEVHRALAGDRALSEQVASVLRDPARPGGAARFGAAEQARVAALVAGRAKQLVPSVARRVIGEWTSSVLSTARSKAARQAAASSRVDIAAPGGSSDSMPLRAMSAREVNYASMSDEQILGM